jgi:hypothetical protein
MLRTVSSLLVLAVAFGAPAHHPTAEIGCCACKHYTKSTGCRSGDCGDGSGGFCWDPSAAHTFGKSCSEIPHDCEGKDKYVKEAPKRLR